MKLLVSDFDGTLYQDKGITKYTQTQIRNWQSEGNYFIIATGRDLPSITEKIRNYEVYPDFIIGNNGATINKAIISKLQDTSYYSLIDRIINSKDSFQEIKISYIIRGNIHTKKCAVKVWELKDFQLFFSEHEVIQLTIKACSVDEATQFITTNSADFPVFSFLKNIDTIDIVDSSINKLFTIQQMENDLGIPGKDIFTIGDGLNDLQMITNYQSATFPWANNELIKNAEFKVHNVGEFIKQISY